MEAAPAPQESGSILVLLDNAQDMEKAEKILKSVKGVEKVTGSDRGFLQVEASKGKAKSLLAALTKDGVKASVWTKVG